MPKLGESITEATIIQWLVKPGDSFEKDQTILEVSTDKVDSEVPAPRAGTLLEANYKDGDVVPIGAVLAIIEADENTDTTSHNSGSSKEKDHTTRATISQSSLATSDLPARAAVKNSAGDLFLSPLVLNIAKEHGLTIQELRQVPATGTNGRIRKSDLHQYLKHRKYPLPLGDPSIQRVAALSNYTPPAINLKENDRIVQMDRMRSIIADHMVYSKHISPHVTCYAEVDLTDIVNWRKRVKDNFQAKYDQKLTYTPIFIRAVSKAILQFPMINSTLRGENEIIIRGDVNIGMATALPTGNLIVPVITNADQKDLAALSYDVNHLAEKARTNTLQSDDIQDGTFTISNVGTFGSLTGTPIINQPQAAILATGIIKKRAEVKERNGEHNIEIRDMMMLALSFDHRIVDGYLGGSFLKCVADELEAFDITNTYSQ